MMRSFLSCLYGSEPLADIGSEAVAFLSCLYGSERKTATAVHQAQFSKLPVRQ